MKAWVIHKAGGPEHFSLKERDIPSTKKGWAL
jgi:hypothetical protein